MASLFMEHMDKFESTRMFKSWLERRVCFLFVFMGYMHYFCFTYVVVSE